MIGVGIIGAGGIARAHARAISSIPDRARLCAAADPNAESAAKFQGEFSIPRTYGDFRKLLSDPEIRMVCVCVPNSMHAEVAVAALEAGKAVLCEKPVAGSLSEVDAIIEARARTGGVVSSVFQWRYGAGYSAFREIVDRGIAGRVLWAQANVLWRRVGDYYTASPWHGTWKGEKGGPLMTLASHAIDTMLSFMPRPVSVSARIANLLHDVEVEDVSASVIGFEDGSMASLNVMSANQLDQSRLEFVTEKAFIASNLEPWGPSKWPWTFRSADPAVQAAMDEVCSRVVPDKDTDLLGTQVRDFVDCLIAGRPAPVAVSEARTTLEVIAGVYKSGLTAKTVELPIKPKDPFYAEMNGGTTLRKGWLK